ncbi:MAG TPA: LysR family transcriptional regulator [Pseudomonas xinjiangensis]|uniref:LysR family transcriptional regulator n=1 Tax=Halopseudomonas xinjiangensis TaxID=487184 RepID=A0A7V1BS91_9GAMM|nr:LysR family transcriptional regulator [Halopseudomonas xinjiangensis]HEC46994.1 LysR family transcriptional regulator [Halopseudomonas xinjiangensis]
MDTGLARTFLEIVRCGSFIGAAERLHVTQAAITARIQTLEAQLNCKLFIRNRSGARLTADGEVFAVHANQMVLAWEAAQRDLPLPEGHSDVLHVGGEFSLCSPLILDWVRQLRQQLPSHTVRAEIGETGYLLERVVQGALDAALVYRPEYLPGLQVEELLEEKLIQVCLPGRATPYVYIDWGPNFRRQHDAALPDKTKAPVSFNHGPLGLQYILESGGAGYFRTRVVQGYLDSGVLERVPMAPEFSFPTYLVYSRERDTEVLRTAFGILRQVATSRTNWSQRWDPLL